MASYHVDRAQLDGLWSYVGNKGEKKGYAETEGTGQFWRSTMIDMDTRMRLARGIAKNETRASVEVFSALKRRGHPESPPPTVSDGRGGIDEAMVEVYGKVPAYQGRGRPPTRKGPDPGWQYLQVVKQRENGRVTGTRLRVIYGDEGEVLSLRAVHCLCGTHPSHDAALQQPAGAKDPGFFQAARITPGCGGMGGPVLQHGASPQDFTARGPGRTGASMGAAHTGDGGGIDRSYLDRQRAFNGFSCYG